MNVQKITENLSAVFVVDEERFETDLISILELLQRLMETAEKEEIIIYLENEVDPKEQREQDHCREDKEGKKGKIEIIVGKNKRDSMGSNDMKVSVEISGKSFLYESDGKKESLLKKIRASLVKSIIEFSEEWKIFIDFLQSLEDAEKMKKAAKFLHQKFYEAKNNK